MLANRDSVFTFERAEEKDLPLLYDWFQQPHVNEWWPVPKEKEDFFDSFLKRIRSTEITPYIVSLNGKPIGYLQSYPVDPAKTTWCPSLPQNTIGIDQFIGEKDCVGKGYGTLFIKEFITLLQSQVEKVNVLVDPETANGAAIRCYEKVGFEKLGEYQAPWGPASVMLYRSNGCA